MQYKTKTHKIHTNKHKKIYAHCNGPSVTKPNPIYYASSVGM